MSTGYKIREGDAALLTFKCTKLCIKRYVLEVMRVDLLWKTVQLSGRAWIDMFDLGRD
jgi:hypothetical protein